MAGRSILERFTNTTEKRRVPLYWIDLLLRSSGRRAGISRTVRLDYKNKTAQVAFKICEGPPGNPEPLGPPYAEPCKITNGYFNWWDVDDLSPKDFVERRMKTKWLGSFSESDVKDDLTTLKEMKFLKESNISVEGSGDVRSISVHLHGRPILIANIKVRGYGLLDGLAQGDFPPIRITKGDTYSRSEVRGVEKLLEKAFAKGDRQVEVFTDVQITASNQDERLPPPRRERSQRPRTACAGARPLRVQSEQLPTESQVFRGRGPRGSEKR